MHVGKVDRAELLHNARGFMEQYRALKSAGFINRSGGFFPSVHYPPITMYPPMTQEELFATYRMPEDGLMDIYAHIPFCLQRCLFCHYPAKIGSHHEVEKDLYLAALEKEMDIYLGVLGLERIQARSVLIGGGTPTYLTPNQLRRFLDSFVKRVDLSRCKQFNFDVDPNTLLGPDGAERLGIMRDYGVNRLTIGVQSFSNETLKNMNRHHGVKEALQSIDTSRRFGFQLNIEFIFGYPGQTLDGWIGDIENAVALDVDEIQLYRLKVGAYGDHQGAIKTLIDQKTLRAPDDEEAVTMKRMAIDLLTGKGLKENIRRVFCRAANHFSHYAWNQCCMMYDQVGFGLTAFSSLRDRFGLNTQSFEEYYAAIEAGKLPLNRGLIRSSEEQKRWGLILPLKNGHVSKKLYRERTGARLEEVFKLKVERLKQFGLLAEDERNLEPTPLGAFFADELVHQFHHPDYLYFPRSEYAEGPLNPYHDQEP